MYMFPDMHPTVTKNIIGSYNNPSPARNTLAESTHHQGEYACPHNLQKSLSGLSSVFFCFFDLDMRLCNTASRWITLRECLNDSTKKGGANRIKCSQRFADAKMYPNFACLPVAQCYAALLFFVGFLGLARLSADCFFGRLPGVV